MGKADRVLSTENQAITNYDYSNLFLTNFKTYSGIIAQGGSELVILKGTVLARSAANGKIVVLDGGAGTGGAQYPLGIAPRNYIIPVGAGDISIEYAVDCKVDETKLIFPNDAGGLDTVVEDKTLRDRISGDTENIQLETLGEFSEPDNF